MTAQQLQKYNLHIAQKLKKMSFKPIPTDDGIPFFRYKNSAYSYEKSVDFLQKNCHLSTTIALIVDDFIVLDVDSKNEFELLKNLAKRHNCKSNLITKTRNGYHVYYSVDYAVKSQNNGNNQIAIKCNNMPIIAPFAFRQSRNFTYEPLYKLVDRKNINPMPLCMYDELKSNQKKVQYSSTRENIKKRYENTYKTKQKNLPVHEYLSRIDTNVYLFGDRIAWLRVLSACKQTNNQSAYQDCLGWSRQGRYSNMTEVEFRHQWNSATGIQNGYAYLQKLSKKK